MNATSANSALNLHNYNWKLTDWLTTDHSQVFMSHFLQQVFKKYSTFAIHHNFFKTLLSKQLKRSSFVQVFLQKACPKTMMLPFTKTKISLSLNWSKVKSQDHSVQVMVQVFWIVCWRLKTSEYSLAYKATEKDNFLNNISRNLWSKSNFLAEYLPQSSQTLYSPSEAY